VFWLVSWSGTASFISSEAGYISWISGIYSGDLGLSDVSSAIDGLNTATPMAVSKAIAVLGAFVLYMSPSVHPDLFCERDCSPGNYHG